MENILSGKMPPEQNELVGRVATIENIIKGQTALLNRAFGNGLPVKMPQEWEDSLNKLEARVANRDRWPEDTNETKQFRDEVSELVTGLPAWLEVKYLPRLSVVRWAAMAFNHLYPAQNLDNPPNDLGLAEEIRRWAEVKPDGAATGLDQELRDKADEVEKQQVEQAIQWAREYLDGKANTQPGSTDTRPDIESIAVFLDLYENDPDQDDQERAEKIASLRKELRSKFHREVEEQQDQDRRAYQRWALREIKAFEEEFQRVSEESGQVSEKAKEDGWSLPRVEEAVWALIKRNLRNKHYKAIQNAMISHLLPIDLALLDLPVLKRYDRAFNAGWDMLDGREEQNRVAESSALPLTAKKSLRVVLENQS